MANVTLAYHATGTIHGQQQLMEFAAGLVMDVSRVIAVIRNIMSRRDLQHW